mgnify:CR=1 FL=1
MDVFLLGAQQFPSIFRPEMFLKPAFSEYIRRLSSVPKIIGEWLLDSGGLGGGYEKEEQKCE